MDNKNKNNILVKIVFSLLIVIMLAFLFFNGSGVLRYLKLKGKYNNLVHEKVKAQKEIFKMQMTIDSLKRSSIKKEQVAREKYNMLNKNEKAFVFKKIK